MPRIRLLWLLAALCIFATACPERVDAPTEGEGSDDGAESAEPTSDSSGTDEPTGDDPPLDDDPVDESEDEPVDETEDEAPAEDEPDPLDLTVDLGPGEPYLDDAPLETTSSMVLDPLTGEIIVVTDVNIRDEGWHGVTFFATAPDGTEGEIQCSYRPDLAAVDSTYMPSCSAFGLPTFVPCGDFPLEDTGEGDFVVDGALVFEDGQILYQPTSVPAGDCDFTGAVVSGGFVGTCDADFSCRSAVFEDGFESGDTTAWSAAVP